MSTNLVFHDQPLPKADFDGRAARLASFLAEKGLGADDVIALLMRNDIDFLVIAEAARLLGIRYVAINWHAVREEVDALIKDSEAQLLIAHEDLLVPLYAEGNFAIEAIALQTPAAIKRSYEVTGADRAPNLQQLAADYVPWTKAAEKYRGMYAFTSGSTGRPKGIRRVVNAAAPDRWMTYASLAKVMLKAGPGDRFYNAAPLYHSAPNALCAICLAAGDIDIFLESKFDPEGFLRAIETHRITHAYLVPTMMVRLLKLPREVRDRYDISSLRYTVGTGSPCSPDVKDAMIKWFGPVIHESYGASEIGFMTLIDSFEARRKPGSVGRIFDGGSVKVLDDDGAELGPGEVGTLYISLPMFGAFEYSNADSGAEDFRYGEHTTVGDMGMVDEDGYIFIMDRKKDMMITGGANVFPAEIEAHLILMPEVADCAVFGAPDPEFGEKIVAAVTLRQGREADLASVQSFLAPRLAKFKIPRKLDIHSALPRQDSGKIFKAKLREPYWSATGKQV